MAVNKLLKPEVFEGLNLSDFVSLDIETTGLDYQYEDIIEFAAVHFRNGEPVDGVNFFIKPAKPIPEKITKLTGISDKDVAGAQPFYDALPQIRDFIQNYPVIAHNVNFDLPFLEYHARKSNNDLNGWNKRDIIYHYFPNPKLDTVVLSRIYFPFLPAFNLSALVSEFQLKVEKAHRALPDAEAAGKIFLEILLTAIKTKFADVQKILQILEPTEEHVKVFFQNLALFLSTGKFSVPGEIDRHKFSIKANYYNIIGSKKNSGREKEEIESIDEEEIAEFFSDEGELAKKFGLYEKRPQQVQMAKSIARAFNNSQFLVVEAGTGTGKSLAYLLPAIKWAVNNSQEFGRVVISTNTKNLQEQLFFKDLPVLHSILKQQFKAVLLKGKGNYLCLDKWVTIMNDMNLRLAPKERQKILPLYFWAKETETGDISENNGFRVEKNGGLWSKMIAENNYCPGKSCKYYNDCFLMKARNNARDAHLVLVNHSLLFSDLAADNAVLSEYVNVIFDEAHNIESTATNFLGVEVIMWQFRDFLNKLYTRDRMETGVLIQLKRRIQSGNLKQTKVDTLLKMLDELTSQTPGCWRIVQKFFSGLTGLLSNQVPDSGKQYTSRHRYVQKDKLFEPLKDLYKSLQKDLTNLQNLLGELIKYFVEIPENSFEYQRQLYQDLKAQLLQCELLTNNLQFLVSAEWKNYVYWFELPTRDGSDDTRLYAAPLDIGAILNEKLYAKLKSAVFTSATLAVNKRFDYFKNRSGIKYLPDERVDTLLLDSPFNYHEQVFLGIPTFFPDPGNPQFTSELNRFLEKLATTIPKGTLTLFTSYYMLNNVYKSIRQTFDAEEIPLLGQGLDGGRHAIINRFKSLEKSFLLGTDSFWEGIDVPGKALEMVVITKLPFDVPSDPIIQARSDLLKSQGRNPFMEFSVPEAVIKFRQGFGRLIRNQSDYGAVIILDNRITKKLYGQVFLQSLPIPAKQLGNEQELWGSLERWFK